MAITGENMNIHRRLDKVEKHAAALPWHHGLDGEALAAAMLQFERDVATIQELVSNGHFTLQGLENMPLAAYYEILDGEQG